IFQVVLQYLPSSWPVPQLDGIRVQKLEIQNGTAKFDLTLTITESAIGEENLLPSAAASPAQAQVMSEAPSGLSGDLEFNSDLFNVTTINRMLSHFRVLLEGVVANPARPIDQLPLLTEREKVQCLHEWNRTSHPYPRDSSIHELFQSQVALTPGLA